MADMVIISDGVDYKFSLKDGDIDQSKKIDESYIPMHNLDIWYRMYFLMKRTEKVQIIDKLYKHIY